MNDFLFAGEVPASKSLYNRALIVKSHFDDLVIHGQSECDDVRHMAEGISNLMQGQPVQCGHSGTVLRFLALRASRIPGTHTLFGSARLFSRPQSEITPLLSQLGVQTQWTDQSLKINSKGWRLVVDGLQINATRSSQFASAVILNSWGLSFPLHFNIGRKIVSEGYLKMTMKMMRKLGMRAEENGSEFFIPANQKLKVHEWSVEPDMSSAFAIAALAAVAGEATIKKIPTSSLQPDAIFIRIMQDMGISVEYKNSELRVSRTEKMQGVNIDIENSPDLFPVLAVLCALAQTPSRISGVGHLQFKESSRLEKTRELLNIMGAKIQSEDTEVTIEPCTERDVSEARILFRADQDHRMAMAAEVARRAGCPVIVDDMQVVSKSFPEFLRLPGIEVPLRGASLEVTP